MKYYSQIKQDQWVINHFGEDYKGFFIEVGANDGVKFSNTLTLENLGWTGICVDASSEYENILTENRLNSQCFISAVSDYNGTCVFGNQGLFGRIQQNNIGLTKCMTMKTLLELTHSPLIIDYVSIDVEGAEMSVLRGFPFDTHIMKLLTIEHNSYAYGSSLKNEIYNFLTFFNYIRVFEIGNNGEVGMSMGQEDWYIHKDFIK
jgi:FkbM family methyltransferase